MLTMAPPELSAERLAALCETFGTPPNREEDFCRFDSGHSSKLFRRPRDKTPARDGVVWQISRWVFFRKEPVVQSPFLCRLQLEEIWVQLGCKVEELQKLEREAGQRVSAVEPTFRDQGVGGSFFDCRPSPVISSPAKNWCEEKLYTQPRRGCLLPTPGPPLSPLPHSQRTCTR